MLKLAILGLISTAAVAVVMLAYRIGFDAGIKREIPEDVKTHAAWKKVGPGKWECTHCKARIFIDKNPNEIFRKCPVCEVRMTGEDSNVLTRDAEVINIRKEQK